jgi:hypothetical protein
MQEAEWQIPVDHTCTDLIPQHVVRVKAVTIDRGSIEVAYEVAPALARPRPGSGPPFITWGTYAIDDLGNRYTDTGGAYGTSPDGKSTEGSFSLQPGPPQDAASLRIFIGAWSPAGGVLRDDEYGCSFCVDLTEAPA